MSNCIICSTKESFAFSKHGYEIFHCNNCGLFRTKLNTSYQKMIKKYYNRSYFTGKKTRAGYANYQEDLSVVIKNAYKYLQTINHHLKPGKLLDVGCATGIFVSIAISKGFDAYGLDISEYAILIAKKTLAKKVSVGSLSRNNLKNKSFNIITLFDVFEHLDRPRLQLKHARKLLKKNGLIVINTGDSSSLLARLEGLRWHYFIPPQHVYFYSQHNLASLLKLAGFRVVKISHQGKWLSLRYLLHLMRTINHSQIADILYRLVHKNFLGKLPLYINLHDNMTIIARKV